MHNNGGSVIMLHAFLSNFKLGMNSILGDEMGLGKTLQVLWFFLFVVPSRHLQRVKSQTLSLLAYVKEHSHSTLYVALE